MKTSQNFGLMYCLLIICQIVLCNYCSLGPYIMLTMLPAMILCIPLTVGPAGCMLIAFASGLAVDWLAEGIIGLNAAAAVPAALLRKPVIRLFFGEDIINRSDSISIQKNGTAKVSVAIMTILIVFLGIYIYMDGAGTRPVWFNFTRFGLSMICNLLLSLIVVKILTPDDRK